MTSRIFVSSFTTDIFNSYSSIFYLTVTGFLLIAFIFLLAALLFYKKRIQGSINTDKSNEQKLLEEIQELVQGDEQIQQAFQFTSNGIRFIDKNYKITKVNHKFCELSGLSSTELIGKNCFEVFPSGRCHTSECPIELFIEGEPNVKHRDIRFRRNNQLVVCEYNAKPFYTNEGAFAGIIEDFKDITDLLSIQEDLKNTKAQYEALMNSMPLGVFIRDFEGNMVYQNSYMDKTFGRLELDNPNIKELMPNKQVNRFFEEDKLVKRLGSYSFEEQLIDNNKVERTYVTHKFKFSGLRNEPLIGGVSIDITKRKNAEHNYYVLSKAINNSPIGIIITSPKGIIETCNPEFERISGQPSERLYGRFLTNINVSDSNSLSDAVKKVLSNEVYQEERYLKLFEGQLKWYFISAAPVLNRHGEIAHLIFIFDDITERKEYEKALLIAKTKAEESDKLKTAFLTNLSHEVRTPLNAIIGFSSLLNNQNISYEEKQDLPNQLLSHSNYLLELIDDLIDISSIETGQFSVKKSECELNKLLQKSYFEFCEKYSKGNLKTSIKLGVSEDSFTILTDQNRLEKVVRHLLSNAVKFTPQGFIEFGYTFKNASTLLFYVIDTGVGLSEQEKEIVFDPFRQADDSTTRNFTGLGLGLAISKYIIERLGGKIWVTSTRGQGSTFFFTLPYIPVRAKFDEFVEPAKLKDNFNWTSKTILFADDIDSNYKFVQTLLKPTGVNLIWAKNGREAIDVVKIKSNIDLVLMDIVMPEIDGFEATKRIKEINNNIKVVGQTAYPSPENQKAGLESGMDSFLSKPIGAYKMMQVINEYIDI